jgi:DNA-directed RNA polymerase subunit RPC12/RpoP
MALSFFAAPLECLHCGRRAPDTDETGMQNELGDEPFEVFHVGDPVPSTPDRLQDAFLRARDPQGGEIRLLQHWTCPHCGSRQWAEVVIAGGRVREIKTVALTRQLLERVHYVDDEISEIYSDLVGPLFDGLKYDPDFAGKLAARLPSAS